MKAGHILMLSCILLSSAAFAQKIAPGAVPKAVSSVFIKDFPGVMAEWELNNGCYTAIFEQNKYMMKTVYNASGARLETDVAITEAELPESTREYISHYSPTISEATKVIRANDHVSFKVLAGSQYMEFDGKGNHMATANK